MLSMLSDDLAHIPPEALERAIDRHVLASPYMPKAADLIKLAQNDARPAGILPRYGQTYADALAEAYNAKSTRDDVTWIVTAAGQLKLVDKPTSPWRPEWKPEPGEVAEIEAKVARYVRQGMTQDQFNALVDSGKFA